MQNIDLQFWYNLVCYKLKAKRYEQTTFLNGLKYAGFNEIILNFYRILYKRKTRVYILTFVATIVFMYGRQRR